jgi:HK97 family phage major capsid protein
MKDMTTEQLIERRAAIATEVDLPEADLDALMEEARAINEELERRKAEAEKRSNIRAAVAKKDGEKIVEKEKKMTIDEIRSSKEYIEAYANYIKTEDDREVRTILTQNANIAAGIPVPTIVDDFIRTAWEQNEILRRVRKTYVRGNLTIGFEAAASDAEIHDEGSPEPQQETITFGKVTLIPKSIKKWLTLSDEAMDMGGEEFLRYIVDEITYRIAKLAQEYLVNQIITAPAAASATAVSVPAVTTTSDELISAVVRGMAVLSPEATDLIVVTTRANWGTLKAAAAAANYAYDPFEGLPVVFVSEMPAHGQAAVPFLIVGDFSRGALMNFPNGEEIKVKRDDLSLAESDLIKFVGRMYVGIGLVADKMFAKVTVTTPAVDGGGTNS